MLHHSMQEVWGSFVYFFNVFLKSSGKSYIFINFCFNLKADNKTQSLIPVEQTLPLGYTYNTPPKPY